MRLYSALARWCAVLALFSTAALAAKPPFTPIVLTWPAEGEPTVRFTFGKMVKTGTVASENAYSADVMVENLSKKPIASATFDIYVFSKDNIRIATGFIPLLQVGPGEKIKTTLHFSTSGDQPAWLKVASGSLPKLGTVPAGPKTVGLTVYSTPPGADLKVDGADAGVTPKQVRLTVGKHMLEFSKNGYHAGNFPIEIGPDDVSGGNINYELGALSHDTVELRDGSVLTGDIEAVTATAVELRIEGTMQSLARNKVRKILLVEREEPGQTQLQPAK